MLELDMTSCGVPYLKKLNKYKAVKQEVPFLSRSIDVVLIDEHDKLITIEFKVKDWKHAIKQAMDHKLGADEAYICLPKRKTTEVLYKSLTESGIGLLYFDSENEKHIYQEIPAPESSDNIQIFRNMLLDNFNNTK